MDVCTWFLCLRAGVGWGHMHYVLRMRSVRANIVNTISRKHLKGLSSKFAQMSDVTQDELIRFWRS